MAKDKKPVTWHIAADANERALCGEKANRFDGRKAKDRDRACLGCMKEAVRQHEDLLRWNRFLADRLDQISTLANGLTADQEFEEALRNGSVHRR